MTKQQPMIMCFALASLFVGNVQADLSGVQFSADMISSGPDGQTTAGKMFVGEGRMRMEMTQQGQNVIRISDQNRGVEWILFPEQQSYLEQVAPPGSEGLAPAPSAETNPCANLPGLTCTRAGEEDVAGRPAVKWEMVMTHEGQTMQGAQWIDRERGLPLRHEMPNGETMELSLIGTETVEGRQVEKWEMITSVPDQAPSRTFQWYDPQLKLSVREEFPGGYVRELTSIRIAEQPDHLFTLPAGYQRMEMPQPTN
ncbi:hypothetical protein CKO25_14040 [Thiocapsa imhoffii]|uniref:DUF4412 domain-containing protein n=1 Tax=Thiocapsa imhoffii TaxID=382777 RepID=A0A9X0WJ93_9GAMM|nr:hypothetical protein [Thiocapsa imhoffii]MBK1645751.1 hypothetical protein [Thiocapsa imhoffii]